MAQFKVFITRPIPEEIRAKIAAECEVDMWHTSAILPPIAEKIPPLDGLMTYGHEPVSPEMIATSPNLKVISVVGVGYDHVHVEACRERGIAVGHTPGVLSDTTADMTMALLLAASRNIVPADKHVQTKQWLYYDPNILWGYDVHHATIGIVGMGRIGYAVAKRALAFDMRVLYYKRERRHDWEEELDIEYVDMEQLLRNSDFITLHVPLTEETTHMIGKAELALMKSTAILVNIARGPVVDHYALYDALTEGQIAGAALDVTEPEPLNTDHPLLGLGNVIIAPHLGSATIQTRMKMMTMAMENLLAGLRKERLPYAALQPKFAQ
ncbi:MAG: D-glycerate dehydrogenase [Candidatus Poribacteria bacterium]|nr:D-glycerate dehydrogenase [Candidatus Poribacteria bacterium]